MMHFLSGLKRSWTKHFVVNLATMGVLTLSFTFIFLSLALITNMSHFLASWGEEFVVAIYLKDNITADEKAHVHNTIRETPDITSVTEVSKSEALKSFEVNLKAYGSEVLKAIKGADENPFPGSIRVKISREKISLEGAQSFAAKIQALAGVEEVSYGQDWISNYSTIFKVIKGITYLVVVVVLGLSIFAVGNAIRASLANRREEIEVLELVGASPQMIRSPFLFEGAVQGFFAVITALIVSGGAFLIFSQFINSGLPMNTAQTEIKFLPWYLVVLFPLVGSLIGALGSYLCVSQINTGWAAADQSNKGLI